MNITYKNNNNISYSCKYHIVWCPKYRRKILVGAVEKRLKKIIKDICNELKCELFDVECDKDHIHLLVECDPQFGVHKLVKILKGRSSRILREEFPELKKKLPTLWTNSYFVSTVGGAPLEIVKQYVANQKTRYQDIKEKGWNNNGRG
ncbi:MAG: IS200/IS605 family transposase [Halobacteriovoraceae bacterium]|nr:IS200/IS605 family transposase [Halobacteriovoraceae bacterium]